MNDDASVFEKIEAGEREGEEVIYLVQVLPLLTRIQFALVARRAARLR